MPYPKETQSSRCAPPYVTKTSFKSNISLWSGFWLLNALLLLCGLGLPAKAQNRNVEKGGDILSSEFTALLRAKSKRATTIAQQLKANPKYSKQILTSNRVEWCGALDEAKRLGGIRATANECINGPADLPANRNALIPNSNTPFKTIRVKTNIFAFDDGSNPVATAAAAAGQIAQLNTDFAPARIRFINNGVNFRASTRFRNPANGTSEISAMKTAFADDPAHNLNMYVFEAEGFNPTLLGSGYFPWNPSPTGALGGFFCDNDAFGAGERTATHEIGHCFGLWHPFHGVEELGTPAERCSSPCAEYAGRSAADGDITGDLCSDTPPTNRNFDCGPPTDDPNTAINEAIDQCNNIGWGTTDYSNYMGYADDNCINHFSPQQMGLMHGWINNILGGWLVGADAGDPPVVTSPSNAGLPVIAGSIAVSFSKPMSPSTTQSAFRFSPALTGTYVWSNNNQTVTFTPTALTNGTIYQVTILGTAPSSANAALKLDGNFNEVSEGSPADDYTFSFRTGGGPANDMFAKAQLIAGNKSSVYGFNIGATKETNEPNHGSGPGGASVWYKWVPTATGNATFDTRTSTFDTSLGVYTGGSVGTLTLIASNEDETNSAPYTSRLTFRAIANTTYYIAVDGYKSSSAPVETGTIKLNWECLLSPPNDYWAQAQLISGAQGTASGTTIGAYDELNEPYYNNKTSGVWYKWVAPANGAVYFDTEGSDFDTNLAVFTGTTISTLTQVATDDDSGTGSLSQMPFTIVGGTTYYIAVTGGYGFDGARGTIKLNWKSFPAPANDMFASPQLISGALGTVSGTTVGASSQTGEPYGAGSPKASVWYKWVAPSSGIMAVDTLGSGNDETGAPFDTMLSVYTGTTLSALDSITTNDDYNNEVTSRAQWTAVAGTTYFISLDSPRFAWREQHGQFKMNWKLIASPANDKFASAQVITGYSGKTSGSTVGANSETNEPYGAGSPKASVWFKWTAPAGGIMTMDTLGSGNNLAGTPFDTILNVYTGTTLSALTSIVNNDDADTGIITSKVRWTAVAGVTYYISVDGGAYNYDESMGAYTLNWNLQAAPANDKFASAQAIAGYSGKVNGSTVGANSETNEPYGAGSPKASVWFKWTAPADGVADFDTGGSGNNLTGTPFDTILNVYTGSAIGALTSVTNNDNATDGVVTSEVLWTAVAGVTYYISVDGGAYNYDESMGAYALNWTLYPAPANDKFANRMTISGNSGRVVGNTLGANKETNEPYGAGSPKASVWFEWTAPSSGPVVFDTAGSGGNYAGSAFDTTLNVYTGTALSSLSYVTSNDDAPGLQTSSVSFDAVGGTKYVISVDGSAYNYLETMGVYVLNWSLNGAPIKTPTITGFTPDSGMAGTSVVISGANFINGGTTVKFNGKAATSVTVNSSTQITAVVPAGATTGPISATTANGTGTGPYDFVVGPSISSFTPAQGMIGTTVTLTGTNFLDVTGVLFNTAVAPVYTVNSATQIVVKVPPGATTGKIKLTSAIGTSVSASNFTVGPWIGDFTPASGAVGASVVINGGNFASVTAVKFNATTLPAGSYTVNSTTKITAKVPTGATTGLISVTNAIGTGASAQNFGVVPQITSFTPTGGKPGTSVAITGSSFTGATSVKFNGVAATFSTASSTSITTTVPATATTGPITVVTPAGTATSATSFVVDGVIPTVSLTTATTTPVGTTPTNNSTIYKAMPTVTGVAADTGSGVARVDLNLYRPTATAGVYEYWNGTAWVAGSAIKLTTTLSPVAGGANVTFSRNTGWPTGTSFPDGTYYIRAYAIDKANNSSTGSVVTFKKATDTVAPTVSFTTATTTPVGTTPANGSTIYNKMPNITGVAADTGSGVSSVELRLYRATATAGVYEYWTGSAWSTTVSNLAPALSPAGGGAGITWSKSTGWPTGATFADGTYNLRVVSYDRAGTTSVAAVSSFKKLSDTSAPTVSFTTATTTPVGTTPLTGATITTGIPAITGKAADVGTGVARVELQLYKASATAGAYDWWNGTAWQTVTTGTRPVLTTTMSPVGGGASVTWSRNTGWPTGANFANGTYYLRVNSYDRANTASTVAVTNFKKATAGIQAVQAPAQDEADTNDGAVEATNPVQAEASVSSDTVTVTFSDKAPVAPFAVTVNGVKVEPADSEVDGSVVTLRLHVNALKAGDAISVSWQDDSVKCVAD